MRRINATCRWWRPATGPLPIPSNNTPHRGAARRCAARTDVDGRDSSCGREVAVADTTRMIGGENPPGFNGSVGGPCHTRFLETFMMAVLECAKCFEDVDIPFVRRGRHGCFESPSRVSARISLMEETQADEDGDGFGIIQVKVQYGQRPAARRGPS